LQSARLYMLKVTVDQVVQPGDLRPLVWIAPAVLVLTVLGDVAMYFDSYLSTLLGQRFLLTLRSDFFRHLQSLSLDFFERRRLGDLLARLTEDIDAIESFLLSGVADAIASVIRIVVFAGALVYLDW